MNITGICKAIIMTTRCTIDTDIDTLPLVELKKLARVALKLHESDRKKSKAYYERNHDACVARSTNVFERRKAAIAAQSQGRFRNPGGERIPGGLRKPGGGVVAIEISPGGGVAAFECVYMRAIFPGGKSKSTPSSFEHVRFPGKINFSRRSKSKELLISKRFNINMFRINVPSLSELRRPRSGADMMAETFRLVRTDPDLVRFTWLPFANTKYSPKLRAANERRRLQAIERRAAVGAPAGRTATGRVSKAKYLNPGERHAGALAKRQATIARRDANSLRNIFIDLATDIVEVAPRRTILQEDRLARRESAMTSRSIEYTPTQITENPNRTTRGRDITFTATMLRSDPLNNKRLAVYIMSLIATSVNDRIHSVNPTGDTRQQDLNKA